MRPPCLEVTGRDRADGPDRRREGAPPTGSYCLLFDPPGSSWLLLDPPASSWLLLDPPGSKARQGAESLEAQREAEQELNERRGAAAFVSFKKRINRGVS